MIIDIPISGWISLLSAACSGYGFGLFAWWWKKMGRATEVYAYITILFAGLFISELGHFYSEIIHIYEGCEPYHDFVHSWYWAIGPMLVFVVLAAIAIRMTRRVYCFKKRKKAPLPVLICPHCGKPCPKLEELRPIIRRAKAQTKEQKRRKANGA